MKYADISPTMRAFLGFWQGFRRIGFSADELYCSVANSAELDGSLACYFTLRGQGLEFNVLIAPLSDDDGGAAIREEYVRVAHALNERQVPQTDLDRIWRKSKMRTNAPSILMALRAKGFRLPDRKAN